MANKMLILSLFCTLFINCITSNREHRVHNLILYPEKHSWCETTPIRQIITSPGHDPLTIDNNICVGACYSYSIPGTDPAEPGELIRPYCDSCQPITSQCYHVTLHSSTTIETKETLQKRVEIILECGCKTCRVSGEVGYNCTGGSSELPINLFANRTTTTTLTPSSGEEVPELLNFDPIPRDGATNHVRSEVTIINKSNYILTPILIQLLSRIQNGEHKFDHTQIEQLIKQIKGDETELNDKNLMEFVNFVNSNDSVDLEIDLNRLRTVLESGKHHLGEEIRLQGVNIGRLVKGPHGSMVLGNKVGEKLNIDLDGLKPNHDGAIIDYENHRKNVIRLDLD